MEIKNIKYIGFYDDRNYINENRTYSLSGTNKMNYIASSIVKAGYNVDIVSPSWTANKSGFYRRRKCDLDHQITLTICPTFGASNKITKGLRMLNSLIWLFFYLLFNTKRGEKIIVYHAVLLSPPIRAAKFLKKFELILEAEEIYGNVVSGRKIMHTWEQRLILSADKYIYSTELLAKEINSNKPHIIIYGIYEMNPELEVPNADGKIHLLYSGIIDSEKKGAFNAVECTKYLTENYVLHIVGFGDIERLCKLINEYNEFNECKIFYDGMKSGVDFVKYCQRCHIGISSQSMDGKYLTSSFPSKVLSYLCMGLRVVSGDIPCVAESKISELIEYYKKDTPEEIAYAIKKIDFSKQFRNREILQKLNGNFIKDIKKLIDA